LAKAQLVEEAAVPGNEFFAEGKEVPAMLPEQEKEAPPIVPEEEPLPLLEKSLDSSKKTILLVEDNEEFREYIREILEEEYNILEFANGKAALLHMEKEIPDLIISDVMMPEMDGLELCEIVKTNETTNHIPIILLTAKSSTDSEIEGLANGADSYITKPFSTKILKLNIVNLLSAKEILRHKFSGNFIIDADLKKLSTPEELFLKKLLEVIESNMENPEFNVSELVREIGMSRTILYKKVNALTNHSIATLIKHVRLKKATDILLKTSYSVFDVATMVGFNDRKHFSKEFKKVYNLSPTDYRNANTPVQDPV
jgi:DNA-binding response OmpR family regulator